MTAKRAFSVLLLVPFLSLFAAGAKAAGWPREVRSGNATIVLYQPQVDSLEGIDAKARIAVSIKRPDRAPEFGALWVAATLDVDRDRDSARIETLVIERARFPDASEQEVRELTALVERAAPAWDLGFPLSELRAGLEADAGTDTADFRNVPPVIIYRNRPAILVTLDGEPRLEEIAGTPYRRVINTPFPIVFDPATREYWLFGSEVWFTTRELPGGRWIARDAAPQGIAGLFTSTATKSPVGADVPVAVLRQTEIVVTTEPAELISTDGEPEYRPLVGDDLLYVTNTGSDLFLEVPTKQYYVVLSGRWFRASSLAGPWSYVDPARVPKAFAAVPRKSEKSQVLAHVPGTDEAKDAIMDAMIPQTSAVLRREASFSVTYDGTPSFEQIPGTSLLYARNTTAQVLKVRDRYYAVDQGIWYVSDSAWGPWAVADSRPEEVARIPPSSPAYNVKYVYIYDYTPDVVYVGYLPGYTWAFPYRGALVYGTGYYYSPWSGRACYYPRPRTWGFDMRYDPWSGWGYGQSWTAGWLSFSSGWGGGWGGWRHGYRPGYRDGYWDGYNTGFWSGQHTGGWFGPGGYRPPPEHFVPEPRRGFRRPDRRQISALPGSNLYAQPGARPGSRPGVRPDVRPDPRRAFRPDRRDTQPMSRPDNQPPNNVYVDREGMPHRLTREGWQSRENRQWRSSPPQQPQRQRGVRPDGEPWRGPAPPAAAPAFRPSPPVELRRQIPTPQSPVSSRDYRPEPGARPPPSGGWGNRAVPRDGPSLPATHEARERSQNIERQERREQGNRRELRDR